jgi:hypothetical protein
MSERTNAQANLDLLIRAAGAAENTPKKLAGMEDALERYARARLFLTGRGGDEAIEPLGRIEPIRRVD